MTLKILVVDAEQNDKLAIKNLLQSAAYQLIEAEDGATAMTEAKAGVDLIILAVELPDQNGFVVCSKLKKQPQTQNIPLFITSSTASQRDFENHMNLSTHADGYFMKPLNLEVLLEEIIAVIGKPAVDEQANDDGLLFEEPQSAEPVADMIELSSDMLAVDDSGSLLQDLGLDSLDIYDAMGTVEVGDAIAERLPSLTIDEVREKSGLLINPNNAKGEDSDDDEKHTKEIPHEDLSIAQANLSRSKSISSTGIGSVKLPPLPAKLAAPASNKELDELKAELEKLKIIESTQQATIERQLDEITQLETKLAQAQKEQASSNDKDLLLKYQSENLRMGAKIDALKQELNSYREALEKIQELTKILA
ncbi:MAG: response regulator [Bradymonadia bacterium]|jgi:CheY-like chemotaxis protein